MIVLWGIAQGDYSDEEFVNNWTLGFDKLEAEVKTFTLDDVERVTWISKKDILQLAHLLGEYRHFHISTRNTFNQGYNNFYGSWAVYLIRTIINPRNIPTWRYDYKHQFKQMPAKELLLLDKFPRNKVQGYLGDRIYAMRAGYLPTTDLVNGMIEGKIKAGLVLQANPILSYPDAKKVYEAFKRLELMVVVDIFPTPSGKVEIYSKRVIEHYHIDPIPTWKWLATFPEVSKEFPLLVTSHMDEQFKLSGLKHVEYFRNRKRFPTVQIHPQAAESIGAKDGDWIWIETNIGKIRQKLVVDPELDPRVVITSFGWWFPEGGPDSSYGWNTSNINMLFPDNPGEPATGSMNLRGYPCRVSKAEVPEIFREGSGA